LKITSAEKKEELLKNIFLLHVILYLAPSSIGFVSGKTYAINE
jgi:hypothetical protein